MEAKRVCLFNEVSSLCGADIKAEVDEIVWKMTHESQLVPMIMKDFTDGFSSKAEIRWGLGINEDLGERVFIMIVYSK